MIKCNCIICGSVVNRKPSRLRKQKNVFCSNKCHSIYKIGKPSHNKGGTSWCKGKHFSEEHRKKISKALAGLKRSDEVKQKYRLNKIGKKQSMETIKKRVIKNTGKKRTKETRIKMSVSATNNREKHWNWRGGITDINKKIRTSFEYRLWRDSVFERDNYTCIWCGKIGGKLNADYIKPFALFPELRFAIDNGRTLCENCHRKTDTYGWRSKNKNLGK